jgi:hypothetical protein
MTSILLILITIDFNNCINGEKSVKLFEWKTR